MEEVYICIYIYIYLLIIPDLGTSRGERPASRPGRVLPPGKDPSTHLIGGWAGLRAGLDKMTGRKILCHCRGSNHIRLVVQSVLF
jgi:hypothetical protein